LVLLRAYLCARRGREDLDMGELLSTLQAARYCGLSQRTLEKRRTIGGGPRFIKLGRSVKYTVADLDEWIANNRKSSTSDVDGPRNVKRSIKRR
jgi:predicted DNA-binding transcriptional regulator AlpA